MAHKEIRISAEDLQDAQTVTQRNIRAFLENDMDIHKNEVEELIDDEQLGVRVLKVRKRKYFLT